MGLLNKISGLFYMLRHSLRMRMGIKKKIITAMFVTAIIPTTLGIYLIYRDASTLFRKSIQEHLSNIASPTTDLLRHVVSTQTEKLYYISKDPTVVSAMLPYAAKKLNNDLDALITDELTQQNQDDLNIASDITGTQQVEPFLRLILKKFLTTEPSFSALMLLDADGHIKFSTEEFPSLQKKGSNWWEQIANNDDTDTIFVSDIFQDPFHNNREHYIMAIPLRTGTPKITIGVLAAKVKALQLFNVLSDLQSGYTVKLVSQSGKIYPTVSKNADYLARLTLAQSQPDKTEEVSPATLLKHLKKTFSNQKRYIVYSTFVFNNIVSRLQHRFLPEWRLFIYRPAQEISAPNNLVLIETLIVLSALIMLIVLFGYLMFKNIVAPLGILQENIDSLAQGKLETRIGEINTGDEIEKLAHSFNIMARKLDLSRRSMEKQNSELVRLNQVKTNFVNMVSHELRTPLLIIKESVSILISGVKGQLSKGQEDILSICQRNANRLHQIINDLLDISRIESGKVEINRKTFNLPVLAAEIVRGFMPQSESTGVKLVLESEKDEINVFADPKKVDHIFTNLIANAFKFTKPEDTITIRIKCDDKWIVSSVEDTGIGIDEDNLGRIFEKFEKLSNQPLSGQGSTGLGLSIAKEFAYLNKGNLWVESTVGIGSKFSFSLPVYTEKEFVYEYISDAIQKGASDGTSVSVLALKVAAINQLMSYMQAQDEEYMLQKIQTELRKKLKNPEILINRQSLEIFILADTNKAGAVLVMDNAKNTITNSCLKGFPDEFSKLIKTAISTFPEDGKTAKTLLVNLDKTISQKMTPGKTTKFGEMPINIGIISEVQREKALDIQKENQKYLGEILIEMGVLKPDQVGAILEEQLGIPYISLKHYDIDKKMLNLLDQQYIIENRVVPLIKRDDTVVLGMTDPLNDALLEKTQSVLNLKIRPVIITKKEFADFVLNSFTRNNTQNNSVNP